MAEEKTFTQEEVDTIVSQRLARERQGQLTPEEVQEYRTMKAAQQQHSDSAQQLASMTTERDNLQTALAKANAENEAMKRERYLQSKGVSADDLDYYAFKIGKQVTADKNFEAAADEYLKDHNKESNTRVDLGGGLSGSNSAAKANKIMNDLIRSARK